MKVTKAQAAANRAHVVETASRLFRERGFDGVGVADLMAEAGFTHGGFYKQFGSKADLIAESAVCGIARTLAQTEGADPAEFVRDYLSREHRDGRATGCTIAALGGDAARQPASVRAAFADGVERLLSELGQRSSGSSAPSSARTRAMLLDAMAHAVGALVLSRACPDDSDLADEILAVSRDSIVRTLRPRRERATTSRRAKAVIPRRPRTR